jgi:competence protein ComEA
VKKSSNNGFFRYSRAERYGIAVLLVILVIVIVLPTFWSDKKSKDNSDKYESFKQELFEFQSQIAFLSDSIKSANERKFDFNYPDYSVSEQKLNPFMFNPNNMSEEKWAELGLSDWQIRVIKNYEAKGGRFYSKEDFKKIYCIKPTEYQILEPYIVIPESQKKRKPYYTKYERKQKYIRVSDTIRIELNSADSASLVKLSGIGPVFASRIINYRNLLGGYVNKNQLLEVYGFKPEFLEKIELNISVNTDGVKKFNINTATIDQLRKHPYLDYYTAKAIIDYRIINNGFKSIEQLRNVKLIHDDLYDRIKDYFTI